MLSCGDGISGSGKSTLLHLLGGLDEPTEGRVQIGEVVLDHLDEEEKSVFRRRKIGFIFQNYNLAPMLNIYENIVFPLTLDGRKPDEELLRSIISFCVWKICWMPFRENCLVDSNNGQQLHGH